MIIQKKVGLLICKDKSYTQYSSFNNQELRGIWEYLKKIAIISDRISQLAIRTAGVRVEMPVKPSSPEQNKRIPASPLVEVLRQFSDSLQSSINQAQDILDSLEL